MTRITTLTGAAAFALLAAVPAMGQTQLSIATGGTGGVYFPLGGGLAELINTHLEGYAAVAEVTGASVENMGLVSRGDSDIAFALADTVYQAYNGTGAFEGRALPELRTLAGVYPNAVQIVALADAGVDSLDDLAGKRVSVGAPGSGTEVNAQTLLEANGITYDDIDEQRLNFNETADALRDGDIDVGIWSVGPPTSSILNLAATREIVLIPLSTEEIANAQAAEPTFAPYTLTAGMYDGMDADVTTVGIPNALVVNADLDEEVVYQITRLIFERVDDLRAIHPAANDTTVEFTMASSPIPLHPGAIRYFEEIGAEIPDALRP
jgi:TRAP transporter TAXI family solute receptor